MRDHGTFPFGQPNAVRPLWPASSGKAMALVVGVYPSAFHVRWSPPPDADDRPPAQRRRPYVASLAVDVEPRVFWDGQTPSPNDLLNQWKKAVKFKDSWGTVQPGHNGPSGDGLNADYLAPLGLAQGDVAMTDVVPWFFVKNGAGSQGAAIERVGASFAKRGLPFKGGTLPARPTAKKLVEIACGPARRESLRRELVETGSLLVISLGQEALDAVRGVADAVDGVPLKLAPGRSYGAEGSLLVDGQRLRWIPLAHPGLIRQQAAATPWRVAHAAWGKRMSSVRAPR